VPLVRHRGAAPASCDELVENLWTKAALLGEAQNWFGLAD
jgi:hypothetical protein